MKKKLYFKHRNLDVRIIHTFEDEADLFKVAYRYGPNDEWTHVGYLASNKFSYEEIQHIACDKVDTDLGFAKITIIVAGEGARTCNILRVDDEGNLVFADCTWEGNPIRFNIKEGRVEELKRLNGKDFWDVYISEEEIVQVDFWEGRYS